MFHSRSENPRPRPLAAECFDFAWDYWASCLPRWLVHRNVCFLLIIGSFTAIYWTAVLNCC